MEKQVLIKVPESFLPFIDQIRQSRGSYTRVDAVCYILERAKDHPEIFGLQLKQEEAILDGLKDEEHQRGIARGAGAPGKSFEDLFRVKS